MKIEDFKIYQVHFGTNCIALCMCFLASKLGLKFETPPSWAQIWTCDWVRSQVELVCEMHWVWVHRLSKIFPKFETKSQLLSLTQGLSLFMKLAPGYCINEICKAWSVYWGVVPALNKQNYISMYLFHFLLINLKSKWRFSDCFTHWSIHFHCILYPNCFNSW